MPRHDLKSCKAFWHQIAWQIMCELEGKENYKKQIFAYVIIFVQK